MTGLPNICVVIPVYNHGLTVGRVAGEAKKYFPVIVVNDGSTDDTGPILAAEPGLSVVTLAQNQGKGAALRAGFLAAEQRGFSHAITIDADGQHATAELPAFAAATSLQPAALIIGVRDLVKEQAPRGRRITNNISTFWFKVETGVVLTDTQCGFRCYPLAGINRLHLKAQHYAYELEIMVKAAWAGIPLVAQPVSADYAAATSRLSHFDPWRDMVRISLLHQRLSIQSFCVPAQLRKISATGELSHLPRGERMKTILRLLYSENADTDAKLALAVGVGFFCGIAPIWGFQMVAAAALAHKFHLNKAIAVTASHISFPVIAPFFMAGGLLLGHYLHTGEWLAFNRHSLLTEVPTRLAEWFLGSLALAILFGLAGALFTWLISWLFISRDKSPA